MRLNDPGLLKSQSYIDGQWIGEGIDRVDDPATGDLISRVPRLGEPEALRAVDAAAAAFGPWSRKLARERSAILKRWNELILANSEDLSNTELQS